MIRAPQLVSEVHPRFFPAAFGRAPHKADSTSNLIQIGRRGNLDVELNLAIANNYRSPEVSLAIYDKEMKAIAQVYRENGASLTNVDGKVSLTDIRAADTTSKGCLFDYCSRCRQAER
jgi:hypothetical protein